MRTSVSLLLTAAIGLAASIHISAANAGSPYVGVAVPIAVTTPVMVQPVVADPVVAQIAVEYGPSVVVGTDYYCCGPAWHSYDWHYSGAHGYGERRYAHASPVHAGEVHARAARAQIPRGRR